VDAVHDNGFAGTRQSGMTNSQLRRRMTASGCLAISSAVCLLIAGLAVAADLRIAVTVVPAYQITVLSGEQRFIAQGTGEVTIRVPAGPAKLRVVKTNSSSSRFRLECNGAEIVQAGQYGAEVKAIFPGFPGSKVQLALKTDEIARKR
jgi:hypothetical protein